ncbi:MAG TPA: outer membrane protein [Bradyrhizobium sp.]|jgi:outer membrane immunogenic protein
MKTRFGWALASAMLLGGIGSASAADMAVKARPMAPVPVWNWTGFYIGGNVGGVWNDTRDDVFPTGCFLFNPACGGGPPNNPLRSDSVRLNGSGFTGGGQAGYNWQNGRFVGGFEADINYNGINDGSFISRPVAAPLVGTFIHAETDKLQWFGTVRGRAGFTVTPSFLVYATGGLAFGQVKSASAVAFTATTDVYAGTLDDTRFGWTVGGGGEWMIAPKWSIKAEYLFIDLGTAGYTQVCITAVCTAFAPPPTYHTDLRVREHVARVGLNYHFGGPVVAKY